jgi:hypothetical protein
VARSLKDVESAGLSADARFAMAYDAARTLSLLIVRATGYRPRTVGAHYNTFLALETADPAFAALSAYFDGCRMKRNSCEYDFAGGVTDTDAEGLLKDSAAVCGRCRSMDQSALPHFGLIGSPCPAAPRMRCCSRCARSATPQIPARSSDLVAAL